MARLNVKTSYPQEFTHEGAPAARTTDEQALRRSVMSCLLWEDEFYEDGEEITARIVRLASKVPPEKLAWIAVEAREKANLRHVPLLLLSVLAKTGKGHHEVSEVIHRVISRADELTEFLAIHAKLNKVEPKAVKKTLSAQMKKGLALAFTKFDEYQLGKYDREGDIRLRDALFLVHAKPLDRAQAKLWKRLVSNELKVPDTWEVALSGGADKKETFERLIREGSLGYLALLRNLRNMVQAGCDIGLVRDAIVARKGAHRVLPFRYVAAARAAPQLEPALDQALCETVAEMAVLPGKTAVLVDVSSSMSDRLSAKSDMTRVDAAAVLASIMPGDVRMFSFSDRVVEVPPRRGMAGVDALIKSQPHNGTRLFDAIAEINAEVKYDRIVVITDEQSHPAGGYSPMFGYRIQGRLMQCPNPMAMTNGYMINVASARNGVGYGPWNHIDGFSENVLRFIREVENAGR